MSTESFHSFLTLSPANSLPVHGTLLRQNKSTLWHEKPCFGLFEIFLLSELVFMYDKLNIYAKKNSCLRHFNPGKGLFVVSRLKRFL